MSGATTSRTWEIARELRCTSTRPWRAERRHGDDVRLEPCSKASNARVLSSWRAGLNAVERRDAVRRVRPDVVDVASGVESAPGVKDPAKIAAFVREVRGA